MTTLFMDGRVCSVDNVLSHHRNHILKSRENIIKPKCNKALKKKLKKYRLRRDGREDPDIIDVSQTLINSLRIKSPNNHYITNLKTSETEEIRPYNYLTKMVRLKKSATKPVSTKGQKSNTEIEVETIPLMPKDDHDKKQMDAFKLLMNSRNKSIGCNSPGKEKTQEETDKEIQDKMEQKEIKAKRILSLNKMAQAKGSLKTLEIEEYREDNIKRKMNDRAKKLKDMIVDVEAKNGKKSEIKSSIDKAAKNTVTTSIDNVNENKNNVNDKATILKSFDLFNDLKATQTNTKQISKEDEEFLKKLSPSIRKKENMLCYFQKMSKDSETVDDDIENKDSHDKNQLTIKVKLGSKTKVKKKNSRHVSDRQTSVYTCSKNIDPSLQNEDSSAYNNSHKRKRNRNLADDNKKDIVNTIDESVHSSEDSRPKRNTKRPVKYTEDYQFSSSDEELHIFTPKKKRKEKHDSCSKNVVNDLNSVDIKHEHFKTSNKGVEPKQTKVKEMKNKPTRNGYSHKAEKPLTAKTKQLLTPKKATKIAPIFKTKPQINVAALEAKQKFLHSGVPNQLKKTATQQINTNSIATDEFQSVVHVQNLGTINYGKFDNIINYIDKNYDENMFKCIEELYLFRKLLDQTFKEDTSMPKLQTNINLILKNIKMSYPKFPVYRTYHLLKGKSKGDFKDCIYPDLDNSIEIFSNMVDVNNINPDKLSWSNKYKPATEKQVIGNFESIKELKRWLVTWTENNIKSKSNTGNGTDSSDFYQSDTDSRETMRNINNLLIITGKVGCGKTMSVYAVAAELAIKVLEVNASTKRTGKIMLQDLQEATQSHKVDRGKSSTDCSQKSKDTNICDNKLNVMKKRGRKKKVKEPSPKPKTAKKEPTELIVSQENSRTGMSLILIDDADIVFDQDDGFCSAISQLIQTSKRPVILVTSSLTCPHLQKFLHIAKIIKMRPFLPRMLGTWLDIMCLVDINTCSPGLGANTLELFKGDIRKTINHLQFYMTSHKYLCDVNDSHVLQCEEDAKVNVDDENSCMSWKENDGWGDNNIGTSKPYDVTSKYFVEKQLQLLSSLNNFNVWWNLPDLLRYSLKYKDDRATKNVNKNDKPQELMELNVVAEMLNTISITDYLEKKDFHEVNTTSKPWYSCESPSVIDGENLASYNRSNESIKNIANELMINSVSEAQKVLQCKNKTEINFPSMSMQRERDRVVSRHNTLTSYLNPSAALDRRALALDYWPSCRNICRSEKTKTDNNSKRNNRFCHYLKSLNVLCKNDYFDNLGESLSSTSKQ